MNIDLDKLEQVARAADSHGENIGEREWYSADTNMAIFPPDPDLSLITELKPAVVLELVRRLRAAEADAKRYHGLRDHMHFSTSKDEAPEMGLRTWLQAPDHNPHADWVGDRFDASVDRCVDRFIAAQGVSHD